MEYASTVQDMSFSSVDTEMQSNLLSEISIVDYRERFLESVNFEAELLETEIFEETEFFDESKDFEDLEIENPKSEFPNEAYKDLMLLVTTNKS